MPPPRDQRLADLVVPERNQDPNWGNAPSNEHLLLGTVVGATLTGSGFAVLGAFVDTATVFPMGRFKSILLIPSGTLTFPSGNVTARLFGARTPKAFAAGAGSALPYADGGFLGPLVTLATAVTTLPNAGIWITPSDAAGAAPGIPDLQWETAHVGLEVNFVGGAPTAGNLAIVMYVAAP